MTVRVYYSTDTGAPTYSGAVGALIGVLKACLVDGYDGKTPAGWTQEFSDTNRAAFRPAAGNRHFLRVDDTTMAHARVTGYESMSDISTGSGAFPSSAQVSGGLYALKSDAASSAARGWVVVADEKRFWLVSTLFSSTIASSASRAAGMFFGDIISAKAGDAFHTLLLSGDAAGDSGVRIGSLTSSTGTTINGHYLARSYTQVGTSVVVGKHTDAAKSTGVTNIGTGGSAFPDPITGGMLLSPLYVHEPSLTRGVIPGGWAPLHNLPGSPGDTFQGTGALAGKTFLLVDTGASALRGRMALEISDTWE